MGEREGGGREREKERKKKRKEGWFSFEKYVVPA